MNERARRFRRAVSRLNGPGALRRRFGSDLRAEAVRYAFERRAEDAPWSEVSEELEVSASLLQKWCSHAGTGFSLVEVVWCK